LQQAAKAKDLAAQAQSCRSRTYQLNCCAT